MSDPNGLGRLSVDHLVELEGNYFRDGNFAAQDDVVEELARRAREADALRTERDFLRSALDSERMHKPIEPNLRISECERRITALENNRTNQ